MVAKEIYNFDLFIYHEDDIVVKFQHVVMFISETKKLYDLVPSSLRDNVIGQSVSPCQSEKTVLN